MAAARNESAEEEERKIEETWGSLVSLIRSKGGGLEEGNTIKMVKKEITIGRCKGINLHHINKQNFPRPTLRLQMVFWQRDAKKINTTLYPNRSILLCSGASLKVSTLEIVGMMLFAANI